METHVIGAAVAIEGIWVLSLMRLLTPNAAVTMFVRVRRAPKGSSMNSLQRGTVVVGVTGLVIAATGLAVSAQRNGKNEDPRPKLTLKAQPNVGIAPARIMLTAELTGGANDFQEYYCPTVLWDWADGTESESTLDCEPYEAGKSEIRRRFTMQHTFRAGAHKVWVRLKRSNKLVASANVMVHIQPGRGVEDDR
jgi:hypothetical protein